MDLSTEIKRKIFHHLSLIYLLIYAFLPRRFSVWILFAALVILSGVEFIRLRRPEVNAWFLERFRGIHRPSEILGLSGIFWTLLGCWLTMVVFTNKRIVLPALGFLTFGDAAAALAGKKWGQKRWPRNPAKTYAGSGAFAAVSAAWALFFVRWPVALLGAASGAWIEAQPLPGNDNVWLPLLSALALSVFNLVLGR